MADPMTPVPIQPMRVHVGSHGFKETLSVESFSDIGSQSPPSRARSGRPNVQFFPGRTHVPVSL